MDQTPTNSNIDQSTDRINTLTFELMENNLDVLIKKYGSKQLIDDIFIKDENLFSAADNLNLLKHFFILKFWPREIPIKLSNQQREQIISLLASIRPEHALEQIEQSLKLIDQNLKLPPNFDQMNIQKQALKLMTGSNNIENLLLDMFAGDYLPDTLNFYRMTNEKLATVSKEIDILSADFEAIYQKLIANKPLLPSEKTQLVDKVMNLMDGIGRSKFFISSEKEKANLGHLADITIKLDTAKKAAVELKKINPSVQDLKNIAVEEIKKLLRPTMQI